jgi:hypothetical protein
LVVVALLALLAGMVTPAVLRSISAAQLRALTSELHAVLESLPVRAFVVGSAMTVDATSLRQQLLDLPQDWNVRVDPPLKYGPTGVAGGGSVQLQTPDGEVFSWRVAPISGHVARAGESP